MTYWMRASGRGLPAVLAVVLMTGAGGLPAQAAAGPGPAGGIITTMAGGVGGPGPATRIAVTPCVPKSDYGIFRSCEVTFTHGHLYVTDVGTTGGGMIRSVDPHTGRLTTPAGDGVAGYAGDGGPAGGAEMSRPGGVTADWAGNLVVADTGNNRVRVVAARSGTFYGRRMTAGHIYLVAGDGAAGSSGDGGPARKARLFFPAAARVDHNGNLVIAQDGDYDPYFKGRVAARIRVVAVRPGRFYGQRMTAGHIYRLALKGGLGLGFGHIAMRLDHAGNLVVADSWDNQVRVVAVRPGTFYRQHMKAGHVYIVARNTGGPTGKLGEPTGVAADPAGNLVVADSSGSRVVVVAEKTGTFYGQPMTAGGIYAIAGGGTSGLGDGGPATSAGLSLRGRGASVAVDSAGNVAVTDSGDYRVRLVAVRTGRFYGQQMTAGDIYTIAGTGTAGVTGDGGLATRAQLSPLAVSLASNPAGDLAVANNNRARFVPARSGIYFGRAMTAGHIYRVAGNGIQAFAGDGGPATQAELDGAIAVALDHDGNVVVADYSASRLRVVAVRAGTFYGQPMTAGFIYTVAGSGLPTIPCSPPFSGDGGPAVDAHMCGPNAVTVDNAGNLLVSDASNNRVRAVAATSGTFYGQPMTAGGIYTIAGNGHPSLNGDGGPATKAGLAIYPYAGLAVDQAGNVMISNSVRVRMVAGRSGAFFGRKVIKGDIYTIARGTASNSPVNTVAVDRAGNVIFQDADVVEVLAARSGRFYGREMTANHIYRVAGGGRRGLGDGGPAIGAFLAGVWGLAATSRGAFLIGEAQGGRVRKVTG